MSNPNPQNQFQPGNPGGPGRPKGKTLKEFAREYLMSLDAKEKAKLLKEVGVKELWRMAEGNPRQDVTSDDKQIQIPIYGGQSANNIPGYDGNKKDIQPDKED